MHRSTPGLPIHHQLLEYTQTHVHRVDDAIHIYRYNMFMGNFAGNSVFCWALMVTLKKTSNTRAISFDWLINL